jgi:phage antirepressor YoqD-like protein
MNNYRYVNDTPPHYSPKPLSMKSTVKILGYKFGYKTLFRILRACDVLDQYSTPYQQYIDEGYFTEDINVMQKGYRHLQTYVMGQRGLEFVKKTVDEFLANNPVPKFKRRKSDNDDHFILIDDTEE